MRSFFLLIAGLLLAGNVSASTETTTTIEAQTIDNKPSFQELHFDKDVQSRRKDWDIFGVLLMSKYLIAKQNFLCCAVLFNFCASLRSNDFLFVYIVSKW